MKYFSMFSGIGGFELGIGDKGECVGYSEIDKYATKVYERRFNGDLRPIQQGIPKEPEDSNNIKDKLLERQHVGSGGHKNYGDATKINPKELPDFDLLVGGFPCQAFSVAGKRKGFDDTRGTLFFDIARILAEKRPRHLVLENVKGLLSHDSGKTFQTILGVLSDLGYRAEWQVLNSKDFGVPQNRERIFIVGHLGNECTRQVFPITGATGKDINQLNPGVRETKRIYGDDGVSPTLNTAQGGQRVPKIRPVLTPDRAEKRQNGRRMKEDGEPAFTVTSQDRHGLYDGARIRRLTPLECERLQGFPDNWTEGESDTQRYKMAGNAVTVNVVQAVMERLFNE